MAAKEPDVTTQDIDDRLAIEIHDADIWDLVDEFDRSLPPWSPLRFAWDLRRTQGDDGQLYLHEIVRACRDGDRTSDAMIEAAWAASDRPREPDDILLADALAHMAARIKLREVAEARRADRARELSDEDLFQRRLAEWTASTPRERAAIELAERMRDYELATLEYRAVPRRWYQTRELKDARIARRNAIHLLRRARWNLEIEEIRERNAAKKEQNMSVGPLPSAVPGPSNTDGRTSLVTGPQPAPPEYGDTEIADRFVAAFGKQLSYIKTQNRWLHWDGKRWITDNKGFVHDLAAKHCKAESALCRSTPGYTDATARAVCSKSTISAILRLAENDQRIATEASEWDQNVWLLGTPDGVVDLRTSTLRPARPEDRVTKCTAVTPSSDPCPKWIAFLHRATGGDLALQAYLQRMAGYFLTGSVREESLHFAFGPGGSGKCTFLHAITGVLADYHVATAIATFTETKQDRHLAEMQGARLVTCSETERGRRWAESRIKEMTGGDRITARYMYGNPFNFLPTFKIMISGNYKPALRPDSAMRRRFQLAPFSVAIPTNEMDRDLGRKLQTEWPAILAWMIEGCRLWQREGLNPPAAVVDATRDYMNEQAEDCLSMWLADHCEADATAETKHSELYSSYRRYSEQSGEKPMTSEQLAKELRRFGYEGKRTKAARLVIGLRLTPPPPFDQSALTRGVVPPPPY
jgi:putative DNA primase/helicase